MKALQVCSILAATLALSGFALATPPPWGGQYIVGHLFDRDAAGAWNNAADGAWHDASGLTLTAPANQFGANEASWAVFNLDKVTLGKLDFLNSMSEVNPIVTLFDSATSTQEVVGIVYGTQDLEVKTTGIKQSMHSVGMTIDIFIQPKGNYAADTTGPGGRFGANQYKGVGYDSAGNAIATLALRLNAVNFFTTVTGDTALAVGTPYGTDISNVQLAPGGSGESTTFLSVDTTVGDPDWIKYFDQNIFVAPVLTGFNAGVIADVRVHATLSYNTNAGWTFTSTDPVWATAPLPGAALLGMIGLGVIGLGRRIRAKLTG